MSIKQLLKEELSAQRNDGELILELKQKVDRWQKKNTLNTIEFINMRKRLKAALERYGRHDYSCKAHFNHLDDTDYACTCGLKALLDEE